jgi:hypothetical protein
VRDELDLHPDSVDDPVASLEVAVEADLRGGGLGGRHGRPFEVRLPEQRATTPLYMRFRGPSIGNVTEALSAAGELQFVGLAEALELCLLLRDKAPERFPRAALRWHGRLCREAGDVSLAVGQAVLAVLAAPDGRARGVTFHPADRVVYDCQVNRGL